MLQLKVSYLCCHDSMASSYYRIVPAPVTAAPAPAPAVAAQGPDLLNWDEPVRAPQPVVAAEPEKEGDFFGEFNGGMLW